MPTEVPLAIAHQAFHTLLLYLSITFFATLLVIDLGLYYIVIVPLRIGGGTRLKIYEAMAAGKAVVSTTIGAEGLDVHHGRDIHGNFLPFPSTRLITEDYAATERGFEGGSLRQRDSLPQGRPLF